jgi:hypothetical protein
MTADLSTRLRIARAAVFAGACVALSATGHSLADGVGVGVGTWGLGFVLVFALAVAAGSREWSQKAITLGLFAGQLGLHLLFSIDPGTSVAVPTMDMSGAAPMSAHSMAAHAGWSMVAAHLVSGTVTGWWLRRGEAACWRSLRRAEVAAAAALRAAWVGLTFIPGPSAPRLVPVAAARTAPPGRAISVWLAQCSPRRGPPEMPIA